MLKILLVIIMVLFFKQMTAYEMRISDWSSDVCSSDLLPRGVDFVQGIAVSARLHQQRDQGCAEVGIVGPMVNRAVKRCRELLAATALPQEFAERGMGLPPCRLRRADLFQRREPAVDLSGLAPGAPLHQLDPGLDRRG